MDLTDADATEAVRAAILEIVPDADVAGLPRDASLRDAFELDSLDFLRFAELLGNATGRDIREVDYPRLRSVDSCVSLLVRLPQR